MIDTVIHHDCLSVLRDMADNSVDAIVTDPPAGIEFMGKEWDSFKDDKRSKSWAVAYDGKKNEKVENNGFYTKMRPAYSQNKQDRENFIAFLTEVMSECLRVIKPGGHALIWALPRTSHWTATALEDAGFEVRDVITHLFGSGFPKSLDISKAIDRMQGAEREVVGHLHTHDIRNNRSNVKFDGESMFTGATKAKYIDHNITKPATPEAAQWAGYGSALKPAAEFWWLCRKPLAESSIAAQVLATGTGGLNIGATRISTQDYTGRPSGQSVNAYEWSNRPNPMKGEITGGNPQGRFPSHLLLSHSLWCVPRGTKRVRGTSKMGNAGTSRHNVNTYGEWNSVRDLVDYTDSDGYEHVEAYDCAPDCPIAELDRQSGVRKNGGPNYPGGDRQSMFGNTKVITPTQYAGDQGGASRYFQHFPPDDYTPFLYQSKASRSERNAGCEDLPFKTPGECTDRKEGSAGLNNPRAGAGRTAGGFNTHPTVKSTSLMRWLIRLITPPDGIVLDPFCGSGSTCVAAIQEGKHFIGIEQDESYVNIANARIAHAQREQGVTVQAQEYDCAPDCPVRILGEQSGTSKSHASDYNWEPSSMNGKNATPILGKHYIKSGKHHGDTGTAARYFQQFAPDLWTQDMHDAEEVFIAEGGYEGEVGA